MKRGVISLFALLLCHLCMAVVTAYPVVEWQDMKSDTLLPYFGYKIPLGNGYADSTYSVTIEYPELIKLSDEDIERWRLHEREILEWPLVDTYISVAVKRASLEISFLPIIQRNGCYYAIESFKLRVDSELNTDVARATGRTNVLPSDRYAGSSVLASGKWVKIAVQESGVYKISHKLLNSMGFKNPSKVRLYGYGGALLPETNIQDIADDLPEQPLWRANNYMLFYAQGTLSWSRKYDGEYIHTQNTYSDYGYYFLTETDSVSALQFTTEQVDSIIGRNLIESYPDYAIYNPDDYSWYHSGRTFYDKEASPIRNISFNTPNMLSGNVTIRVAYAANSAEGSNLNISLNGAEVGSAYISRLTDNSEASTIDTKFKTESVAADKNVVKLEYSASTAEGRVDYVTLNYERELKMYGNSMNFRTGTMNYGTSFSITNATPDMVVWRKGVNGDFSLLPALYKDGILTTYSSTIKSSDELIAVKTQSNFPEPIVVNGNLLNQNLHSMNNVDMVIIVPQSGRLVEQAERLAELHRQFDSLAVAVVRADQIYNEFSSGTPDATAYRRFLKMLYDKAELGKEPRYLLLFGDGAWDNRMNTQEWKGEEPEDYLLCYESANSVSHIESFVMEDYFGLLDDGEGYNLLKDKPDIGIGRLPVKSANQAKAVVDKIVNYRMHREPGIWKNSVLILGDDGDNNIHMRDADKIAAKVAETDSSLLVDKIYWDSYSMEVTASGNSYPSVRKELLEKLQTGALLVNYSGHGSADVLSHELVMDKGDMTELSSSALPFWITASCDITPFDSPLENIGENLMLNANGGAIGLLTTTRTVYASMNYRINALFTEYLLKRNIYGQANTMGDALRLTKEQLVAGGVDIQDHTENKLHFVLLGDPALRLDLPEFTLVVDSFNHKVANTEVHFAKAGDVITISGHIEDSMGNPVTADGIIYPKIYDNERTVTTLNNAATADKPFTYSDRDRVLYSGSDSVKGGLFNFTFPVPLDINYSNQSGLMLLYAELNNGTQSANGSFGDFIVGGTADNVEPDSTGPTIKLYLNTPEFRYGADVNTTPVLVAELSDKDGLNSSGNGIGHDIMISIDNNPLYTYVLNNYFTSETGNYTKGRVKFEIPELPTGKHTLMFRAWDVKNNSSTVYLGFNVVDGLKPVLSVTPTQNPAKEHTTFVIQHDRPGDNVDVLLKVLSTDGREVWSTKTTDNTVSGVCMVDWNLSDANGAKLSSGIYMVYVMIEDAQGVGQTASTKLIIVRN